MKPARDEASTLRRRRIHNALKILVFTLMLVATVALVPKPRLLINFEPGKPAPRDLYAPKDFKVFKTEEQLRQEQEMVAQEVPPVLEYIEGTGAKVMARKDSILASLGDTGILVLSPQATQTLGQNPRVLDDAAILARTFSERGLVEDKNQLPAGARGQYTLLRGDEERIVDDSLIQDRKDALAKARSYAVKRYSLDTAMQSAFIEAFNYMLVPSIRFNERITQKRRQEASSTISDVAEEFVQGQLVFSKGEIIDSTGTRRLQALKSLMGTSARSRWGIYIAIFIIFGLALSFFLVYRREVPRWTSILGVLIGWALIEGSAWLVVALNNEVLTPYFTLLPYIPVLLSVILDSEAGVFVGFLASGLVAAIFGGDFGLMLYGMALCGAGGFSSRFLRTRYQLYLMILILFLAGSAAAVAGFLMGDKSPAYLAMNLVWALVSGFTSVLLVFVSLPMFERVFKVSTDFLLSELASLQHPLLRELAEKAPGTFTHTVLVGNLCEAGARSVGASPLMARVGAYYHDIGKMVRPEFFVENQRGGFNPHDRLSPKESAQVLISHVKEGERMADAHGLPREIKRFISTHHGTSLMRYFYAKAKEQDPGTPESDFRYPGPKPETIEEGICMLADSCEAAVRALDNPTEEAIRKTVEEVFAEKLSDGQLSDIHMTPSQLDAIKSAFIPVLMGTFHTRIAYPR